MDLPPWFFDFGWGIIIVIFALILMFIAPSANPFKEARGKVAAFVKAHHDELKRELRFLNHNTAAQQDQEQDQDADIQSVTTAPYCALPPVQFLYVRGRVAAQTPMLRRLSEMEGVREITVLRVASETTWEKTKEASGDRLVVPMTGVAKVWCDHKIRSVLNGSFCFNPGKLHTWTNDGIEDAEVLFVDL